MSTPESPRPESPRPDAIGPDAIGPDAIGPDAPGPDAPGLDTTGWLAAAISGGLPEPGRTRWQPLRVGIINLWEYDDAEFWFADGRMVLRGGNGAGKTKVLELTTLMLLRGEIVASVLDPFGSQHRTMRYNLLPTGDGDDPRAPADAGLGYAWAEFGRVDEDGRPRYFVCGLGASARRGTGTSPVTTWQFVTPLRPGKDVSLAVAGRPIDEKDLKKLDGVRVFTNATLYRDRLAAELFELDATSYDNLTELLKQLRKPKLGERLNPTSLAETLREALPPLATNEITQLAEGWDHLDQLRRAVEKAEEAATAVAAYVRTGWKPWARAVLRGRADVLAEATTRLDNTTRAKRQAETALAEATATVKAAKADLEETERSKSTRETELRELLDSRSFQDARTAAGRVESLRKDAASLDRQGSAAGDRVVEADGAARRARQATERAGTEFERVRGTRDAAVAAVSGAAVPAGLGASAQRHLADLDVAALLSDHSVRVDRLAHLRALHDTFTGAERAATASGQTVAHREDDRRAAERERAAAARTVEGAVDTLCRLLRDWAAGISVARCDAEQVETWCDLVAELTVIEPERGTVAGGASVGAAVRAHVAGVRRELAARREVAGLRRAPLAERLDAVRSDLEKARHEVEAPPPEPTLWVRRRRPAVNAGQGAPFWRCVQPVDGLPDGLLDGIEATLAAAGLLDAWLDPDGGMTTPAGDAIDTYLAAGGRAPAGTLLAVLEPTPAGGVPEETIRRVLRGIGWHRQDIGWAPPDDVCWLSPDGGWQCGRLSGRAQPTGPAAYLGATTRQAARQRRIAALEAEAGKLDAAVAAHDAELATVAEHLTMLAGEERRIPDERPVTESVTVLAERERQHGGRLAALADAQTAHGQDLARKDQAWAAFAEYAGTHAFPLKDLDTVASALSDYRNALGALANAVELYAVREEALHNAKDALIEHHERLAAAEQEKSNLDEQHRQATVRLRTAEGLLGTDYRAVLDRRDTLDRLIAGLDTRIGTMRGELTAATVTAARAEESLRGHEERRGDAEQNRDRALEAWWQAADAGLFTPLNLEVPERRVVETALASSRAARRDIALTVDENTIDRAWRRCYTELQKLREDLLPNRDAQVMDDADDAGLPRVVILADTTAGWQSPADASETLTTRVREQRDRYDAEQQRVLTTLLGSTFIEHLKDQLDYTAHTFTRINQKLAAHPTRQGHTVRLDWEADPADPDASAVVTALGQGYQQLVPERQEMVRAFLARKIEEARGDAAAGGAGGVGGVDWKDQLARALDYRTWLRISLRYRSGAGGAWSPFDTAKHAAKSGGEKVVLLSQPLFAAAVVAYDAAGPHAPRWVWLDEAMTGVDSEVKASFMALTVSFELDVMLTAHDEWCTYRTVPAVAIYDLARHAHLPGVDAMPYLWCGDRLTQVDVDLLGRSRQATPLPAEGLFAAPADEPLVAPADGLFAASAGEPRAAPADGLFAAPADEPLVAPGDGRQR